MALSDYYLCDVCSSKAFYDARLSYDFDEPVSYGCGSKLGYAGDMAVICDECSKTHRVVIEPISAEKNSLIAAAPDLLEALILLEHEMVESGNARSKDYGWTPAIEKTRAAIAKATEA